MPNNNPFAENAHKYINNGYSVIPVKYAEKRPVIKNWTQYSQKLPTVDEIDTWTRQQYNIGLCTGKLSNIIAIDLDNDIDGIHNTICSLLPKTPVIKYGAKGCTNFYQYNGEISKTLKYKGQQIGDLLSDNRQCVLPPSMHPNGSPYTWKSASLSDFIPSQLPIISTQTWDKINALLSEEQKLSTTTGHKTSTPEEIQSALDFINPDESYDTWLKIGMALHQHSHGAQWALDLFDSWSKRGAKYAYDEPATKWASFSPSGDITINTLFYLAKQNGYGSRQAINLSEAEQQMIFKEAHKKAEKQQLYSQRMSEIAEQILKPSGLVDMLTKYIQEVSYKEQPILALSGAIVAAGAIYAKRVQTESNLRSNIYCFSIGETGCGKEDPRRAIRDLFNCLSADLKNSLSGDPVSSAGLLSAIEKANGKIISLIDEIGHFIAAINGKNSQSYSKDIIPLLTKLYSSANSTFLGREYSQRSKDAKPRVDIEQPCVCVLGSSVPSRVYGSITKDDVLDGFMTRWIILETEEINPTDNPNRKTFSESSGPRLIKYIGALTVALDNKFTGSNFADIVQLPYVVPADKGAKILLETYKMSFNKLRTSEIQSKSEVAYLYTRAYENLEKLALIAAEIETDTYLPIITEKSVKWAYYVVLYSIERMKALLGEISKSAYEKQLDDMEERIRRHGKITKSVFCDICRKFNKKVRDELLADLIESGRVHKSLENGITYIKSLQ